MHKLKVGGGGGGGAGGGELWWTVFRIKGEEGLVKMRGCSLPLILEDRVHAAMTLSNK